MTQELRDNRFQEMRIVQSRLKDLNIKIPKECALLEKRVGRYKEGNKDADKNTKASTRLYFILKLHEYLTGGTVSESIQCDLTMRIGVVGEYCITLMYLDNHLQDSKYGVHDEASRKQNRLEYQATRKNLYNYIYSEFSSTDQQKIKQSLAVLFRLYKKGMELDKTGLTYEAYMTNNLKNAHLISNKIDAYVNVETFLPIFYNYKPQKYTTIQKEDYLKFLLTRAFLINAVFFQVFAQLMIEIFGQKNKSYDKLLTFARVYGIAQQLVNDNCDYLPVSYGYTTMCKLPQDTFSDLRRRLITLPIMLFFENQAAHNGDLYEWYSGNCSRHINPWLDADQRDILNILKESGAIRRAQGLVCALADYGEKLIDDPLFEDMFSFVRANRFYLAYSEFQSS